MGLLDSVKTGFNLGKGVVDGLRETDEFDEKKRQFAEELAYKKAIQERLLAQADQQFAHQSAQEGRLAQQHADSMRLQEARDRATADYHSGQLDNSRRNTDINAQIRRDMLEQKRAEAKEKEDLKREKMEMLDTNQTKQVTGVEDVLNNLDELKARKAEGIETGPIDNLLHRGAAFLGLEDAKTASFAALSDMNVADYIRDKSGLAVTDMERRWLEKQMPRLRDPGASFDEKLEMVREAVKMIRYNRLSGFDSQGKNTKGFDKDRYGPVNYGAARQQVITPDVVDESAFQ